MRRGPGHARRAPENDVHRNVDRVFAQQRVCNLEVFPRVG